MNVQREKRLLKYVFHRPRIVRSNIVEDSRSQRRKPQFDDIALYETPLEADLCSRTNECVRRVAEVAS
jgi:hypothetical protein